MQLQDTLKLPLVEKVWARRGGLTNWQFCQEPRLAMLMALSAIEWIIGPERPNYAQ
jgi:hypothetical protein